MLYLLVTQDAKGKPKSRVRLQEDNKDVLDQTLRHLVGKNKKVIIEAHDGVKTHVMIDPDHEKEF